MASKATKVNHAEALNKLQAATRVKRCHTCNDKAASLVAEVIEAAKKEWAALHVIYAYIETISPGFRARVGYDAFRKHAADHLGYCADKSRMSRLGK